MTNEVKLPDDKPEAFDEVVKFVYSGGITVPLDHECSGGCEENCEGQKTTKHDIYRTLALVELYVLGDRLCMEELCNLVVDVIRQRHKDVVTSPIFLTALQDAGLSESPLTKFLVRQMANDICVSGFAKLSAGFDNASLPAFFERGGVEPQLVVKRMSEVCALADMENVSHDPSQKDPHCMYHQHRDTPKCVEDTEGGSPVSGKRKRT